MGPLTRPRTRLVPERAVAVAQQHRHVAGAGVGDGQVGAAVAVEVPRHEASGPFPAAYRTWFWKVPSPLPSNTDTSLEPELATARSVRPSPVKSPATRATGGTPPCTAPGPGGAVAVAHKHRHVVGAGSRRRPGRRPSPVKSPPRGRLARSPRSHQPGRCRRRCPAIPTRRWSFCWRRPGR